LDYLDIKYIDTDPLIYLEIFLDYDCF